MSSCQMLMRFNCRITHKEREKERSDDNQHKKKKKKNIIYIFNTTVTNYCQLSYKTFSSLFIVHVRMEVDDGATVRKGREGNAVVVIEGPVTEVGSY